MTDVASFQESSEIFTVTNVSPTAFVKASNDKIRQHAVFNLSLLREFQGHLYCYWAFNYIYLSNEPLYRKKSTALMLD